MNITLRKAGKVCVIILAALGVLSALTISWYLVSKSRSFQLFGNLVNRVETQKKTVALTFDDGPTDQTQSILKVLDELGIKATFYLIGSELKEGPDYGKLLAEDGQEIGNHTYTHKRMVFKSYGFVKREIEKTSTLIRKTGYTGEITFRPPYCKKFFMLPLYLKMQGITSVTWDVEPETDLGFEASADKYSEYVMDHVQPGSIILFHGMRENNKEVLEAVKVFVKELQAQGYQFVTVSELMKNGQN